MLILIAFLCLTPFLSGLKSTLQESGDWLHTFVYHQKTYNQGIALKDQLNVLSYNSNLTIPKDQIHVETTAENPASVPQIPDKKNVAENAKKKIYIYNSHQMEAYKDGKTVMDAGAVLGKALQDKGYKVVLETNDFPAYLKAHGMNYNQSYVASYKFINEAMANYGGFDLCIDLHRDSIPRSASFVDANGKRYATAMMVIGGLGKNAKSVTKLSLTLTDIMNSLVHGIMKAPMTNQGYYNQEVHENMVLIEIGGDVNPFDEICNTAKVLAQGIDEYMKGEQK